MPASATFLAFVTITLWSFLALLAARLGDVPPFLLVGVALSVCGLVSSVRLKDWRVPWRTFVVGVGGIFGYHFLYFSAFQFAPAVEANLINYLWPLLIVLLAPLYLPGYPLQRHHLWGAGLGLLGAGLIVTGGQLALDLDHLAGYLLAAGAALAWSSYSLLSKRVPPFPTAAVGVFCLFSGAASLAIFAFSTDPWAVVSGLKTRDWVNLVLLGAGPMGAAFFTWDAALKRGDPRVIGSLAYLTPLTSTLVLVAVGRRPLTWITAAAMVLIVAGAVVGSLDLLRPHKNRPG